MFYFFRINDPYRLAGLLVLLILVYLPLFIDTPPLTWPEFLSFLVGEKIAEGNTPYSELVDSVGPFSAWFYGFADFLFGRSLTGRHIFAFLIVYLQSVYVGITFIDKKVFTESTYLPSFIFSALFFFSFDTIALTGELVGSGFLLVALSNLIKVMEFRMQRDETFFNLGFCVSIATLFEFSFVVFLLAVCVSLIIFTRNSVRSYLLVLFGFGLPHALLMSIYFLQDNADVLYQYYYAGNLVFSSAKLITWNGLLILGSIPLFYFVVSLVMLNRESRLTKYQSQLVQIMFLWIFFSCIQILYSKNLRPQSLITLVPGVAFFITHFLLVIRRKKFAELNTWILFVGIIAMSYLARYGYLNAVTYDQLVVKTSAEKRISESNKRILVLGADKSNYLNNKLATPFLNWELSREIFEGPEYYENVISVSAAFMNDSPELVLDPDGYLKPFLARIPEIRNKYVLSSPGVYSRKN